VVQRAVAVHGPLQMGGRALAESPPAASRPSVLASGIVKGLTTVPNLLTMGSASTISTVDRSRELPAALWELVAEFGFRTIGEQLSFLPEGIHSLEDCVSNTDVIFENIEKTSPKSTSMAEDILGAFQPRIYRQERIVVVVGFASHLGDDGAFFTPVGSPRFIVCQHDGQTFDPPLIFNEVAVALVELGYNTRRSGPFRFGTLLRFSSWPVMIPDYGGSFASSWALSVVNAHILERVWLPPVTEQANGSDSSLGTGAAFREAVKALHHPTTGKATTSVSTITTRAEVLAAIRAEMSRDTSLPSHGDLPSPRLLKNYRDAELYAAEVMTSFGFTGVTLTGGGADEGIDVRADGAVAQVKMEACTTSRPVIQALFGVAVAERSKGLFFSLAGYTPQALNWADRAGVACFEFAFDGSLIACTTSAKTILRGDGVGEHIHPDSA
jgi:Restriction endonuclease